MPGRPGRTGRGAGEIRGRRTPGMQWNPPICFLCFLFFCVFFFLLFFSVVSLLLFPFSLCCFSLFVEVVRPAKPDANRSDDRSCYNDCAESVAINLHIALNDMFAR